MGALQVVSNFQSKDEVELLQSFSTGALQASTDKIDELVASYAEDLIALKEVSALMTKPAAAAVLQYFNEAQWNERYGNTTSIGSSHFAFAEAKAALDAQYWDRSTTDTRYYVLHTTPNAWDCKVLPSDASYTLKEMKVYNQIYEK